MDKSKLKSYLFKKKKKKSKGPVKGEMPTKGDSDGCQGNNSNGKRSSKEIIDPSDHHL